MNVNLTAPAFPCTPMKDQFNQWIVPNAGINKLEYFALELYKVYKTDENETCTSEFEHYNLNDNNEYKPLNHFIMKNAINDAITLIELIEQKNKPTDNEKTSKLVSL